MSIVVNVSGRRYEILKEVLLRSQMFSGLIEDCTVDGEIYVARSAKLFEYVYAFMVSSDYPYPKKYSAELKYYLIDYVAGNLYDPDAVNLRNEKEICKLKTAVDDLSEQLADLKRMSAHQAPPGYELGESCKYMDCTSACMLPVCEYHRGRCCHSYGDYACDCHVHSNEIYCNIHTKDH